MCGDFQGTYANRIERDCAGFRGPGVESLTEEDYLTDKRRYSWKCQGEK